MNKTIKIKLFTLALFAAFFCFSAGHALATYPAPQFKTSMVFSFLNDDGTSGTFFFARVSGPSPEDITALTVTGPSGTFNLVPGLSFKDLGMIYYYAQGLVVDDGTYTFSVTDSQGRTATIDDSFAYMDSLPQVDSTTMSPAMGSYVGTTTPTLSASSVSGDYRYEIMVWDMDGRAMWFHGTNLRKPTITIPSGVLLPNMAYRWAVRVWDVARENYHESKPLYFYTGTKGDPVLNMAGVLSYPLPTGISNVAYGRGINTAPWDIAAFTVTGQDEAVYNLAATRAVSFQMPAWNYAFVMQNPPASIPDGAYVYTFTDKSGKTATTSVNYTYNAIPEFSADERVPENNAYFDTQRPTFSWGRVSGDPGDGSYLYSVRITDYTTGIRWYDSPRSPVTSYTLPNGLNLPKGSSYKWMVTVYDAANNNYRGTDYRIFTINGPTYPVCDIKANGSDGPIVVSSSEQVLISIELDPGEYVGQNADWWVSAYTPFDPPANWYSYVYPGTWKPGIFMFANWQLFSLFPPADVLYLNLPVGIYTFFFAVDYPDETPMGPWLMMDSVKVQVQ